jgi:iron complex outermembrane receptor protein
MEIILPCIRRSGLLTVAMCFFLDGASTAQDVESSPNLAQVSATGSGATAEVERVIVTGSNIPSAEEVGPNPVQIVTRDFIEKSGEHTTAQLLRDLPIAGANGIPVSNNAAGFTPGASSISLRGFDTSATLVLIDGRRVAPYPIGGAGLGTQAFIDLNSIPAAAIESIEILKDGASTTYGADAVAGVINIKFRHDYRRAESNVEYGNTLDKDNGEFSASLLFGTGNDNTNVSGVLNYYHRNSIFNRDRAFSRGTAFSSNSSPGNFQVSREAVIAAGGTPPDNLSTFFASPPRITNGNSPASDYRYARGRISFFNPNLFSGAFPETERYGGFVNFDHKFFGDQLVVYGDALYQNVKSRNELAPNPTGSFQAVGFPTIAIPPHAPGATLGGPTYADTGVPAGAFNPFNPFQQTISGGSRYRLAEFGTRIRLNETDAVFSTLGVKGDKLFDGTWGYDAGVRYSQVKNTEVGTYVSVSRFNRILNAADPIFDPNSSEFIGTTVPYNPFGDFRRPIPSNSAGIDFATVNPKNIDTSKLATLEYTMYTTSLFKLPAGGVGLPFGGQIRRESIRQDLDDLLVSGDAMGVPTTMSTDAGRKSYALFAEALVPIFSSTNAVPGFHSLEFTGSTRFEEFLNNKTNIVVPKVGVRWQPFDESLTIRATWGEGFRQPSLFELAASSVPFFRNSLFDPITGQLATDVAVLQESNPKLDPEDAREFSGGIVYTPKFVPSLTIGIDLWDIERTGVVTSPPAEEVLAREAAGMLLPGEVVLRNPDGSISRIIKHYINGGAQTARGVDLGLSYERPTPYGTFTLLTQATYLDSFRAADTASTPQFELRSSPATFAGSDDAYLKWKAKGRLDWTWKGFDLNTTVTYLDGFHELLNPAFGIPFSEGVKEHWVKQTWFFDVQASYELTFTAPVETHPVPGYSNDAKEMGSAKNVAESTAGKTVNYGLPFWKMLLNNTRITVGCNNVFGHDPPEVLAGTNAGIPYPSSLYDSVGRFVYVSVKKKF